MFTKATGDPWIRGIAELSAAACLPAHQVRSLRFHILRHTYGAQCVMGGMPLPGARHRTWATSTTRMTEKHYAHLTSSFVRDTVRQFAPSFGIKPEDKVVALVLKPALPGGHQ